LNPRAKRLVDAADFLVREIVAILQEKGSTELKVLAGALLFDLGNRFKRLLEPIKDDLRESVQDSRGTHIIPGEAASSCTVQYPVEQVRLRPYINEHEVRKVLGDRFEEYFIENVTVTPVKDIQDKIATASTEEASLILSLIEVHTPPRRTSFKRTQ